jgi:hypothetical protein
MPRWYFSTSLMKQKSSKPASCAIPHSFSISALFSSPLNGAVINNFIEQYYINTSRYQRGLEPIRTEVNTRKKSHVNKLWNFSYLLQILVREISVTWNSVKTSVPRIHDKLIKLGLPYYEGKLTIVEWE